MQKELEVGRGVMAGARKRVELSPSRALSVCKAPRSQRNLNWNLVFQVVMEIYFNAQFVCLIYNF